MRDYYQRFIQTKNSGNTQVSEVSKVSKGQIFDEKRAFDTFDTGLPVANPENFHLARERQAESLIRKLDEMILRGVSFDVGLSKFQIVGADYLSKSDKDFLSINREPVLCTLQQSLLTKHIFTHSKDSFSDFAFEVCELESVLTENGVINYEAHFEAVSEVTQKWFSNLLNLGENNNEY